MQMNYFSVKLFQILFFLEKMVENRGMQDLVLEMKIPTETVTEITDGGKEKVKSFINKNMKNVHIAELK